MGLPEAIEPAVDIGIRDGDRALPGGIYCVSVGDGTINGFATTLSPRQCREILERGELSPGGDAVRLHYDAATEITLVHTVTGAEPAAQVRHRQLEDVLAAFAADELLHELAASPR